MNNPEAHLGPLDGRPQSSPRRKENYMLVAQRRNEIKKLLIERRSVRVADLVQEFDVSEETIRRDLGELEAEGLVRKNYGGAILVEELQNVLNAIHPVQKRKFQFFEEKDAIGRRAAGMVHEGQVVILDAGSTTWCIARHLKDLGNLTVVTNSLSVAEELSRSEGASVFVLGGQLVKRSMSLVGPQAEVELRKYNADLAFVGTSGISLRRGFTSADIYEAETKRAMISAAQKAVIAADHSKLQKQGPISFDDFRNVSALVTSDLADDPALREIEKLGVEVITSPTNREESP